MYAMVLVWKSKDSQFSPSTVSQGLNSYHQVRWQARYPLNHLSVPPLFGTS